MYAQPLDPLLVVLLAFSLSSITTGCGHSEGHRHILTLLQIKSKDWT